MTAPWLTPIIEEIGRRRFVFHPPVANVAPNDWRLGGISVTCFHAVNSVNGLEVAVPRQFVDAVTDVDDALLVVGLVKELEFRDGAALPRVRRVIEMPRTVDSADDGDKSALPIPTTGPASVVAIRLERSWDRPLGRFLLLSGAGAALMSILAAGVLRDWVAPLRNGAHRIQHADLGLSSADDYRAVTRKLGFPVADGIIRVSADEQVRALTYPKLHVTVLLVSQRNLPESYAGMVNSDGRVVHWVHNQSPTSLLGRVPRF